MADEPYNLQDFCLPGPPLNNVDYYYSNAQTYNDAELGGNADINNVNNNDVFTYPKGMDITKHLDDVYDIINFHALYLYPKYAILQSYYEGKHYNIVEQDPTKGSKPDARKQINLPKRLVNAFNGYDCGNAVQVSLTDPNSDDSNNSNSQYTNINDQINKYLQKHQFWTMSMRLNTMASIYGRSYLYAYYDDSDSTNPTIDLIPCSPLDTIVVYDDTVVHRPMFAIRYSEDDNNTFSGVLITQKGEMHFSPSNTNLGSNGKNLSWDDKSSSAETRDYPNGGLACLPVIEMTENDGRIGIFCDCLSLLDSIDKIESQKENDLLAVSNSYLVIQGVKMSPEQLQQISNTHVINPYPNNNIPISGNNQRNNLDVKFLAPQINDNLQEHTLDRDISQVYQIAQVVDLSDPKSVASAQTATEIHQLYQNMEAKAKTKDAQFDRVLSKLFLLLFNAWDIDPSLVDNLQYHHTLATPVNDLQEAQAYNYLSNTNLPTPVKLSYLEGHIHNNKQTAQAMDSSKSNQQTTVANQIKSTVNNAMSKPTDSSDDSNSSVTQAKPGFGNSQFDSFYLSNMASSSSLKSSASQPTFSSVSFSSQEMADALKDMTQPKGNGDKH